MIEEIEFQNFKSLKDTRLKLGSMNLLIGPNGSGKSTVFQALKWLAEQKPLDPTRMLSFGASFEEGAALKIRCETEAGVCALATRWNLQSNWSASSKLSDSTNIPIQQTHLYNAAFSEIIRFLQVARLYAFEPDKIGGDSPLEPDAKLTSNGSNLPVALDALRDEDRDAFTALEEELHHWLPDFDAIQFRTLPNKNRAFRLRTTRGKHSVEAKDLSEGTLIALALLTLAYHPKPPSVICLEEPDRALHPRLMRQVRDALYRLAYPQDHGVDRAPVQIIATTHSPFFLDLFKDYPEEVTIAEKGEDKFVEFRNLGDHANIQNLIADVSLGEVWYSGILGGVPLEAK